MKKLLFIMNPVSGQKRANKFLPEILSAFNRADYEILVHMTAGSGDAAAAAERRGKDADLVVCCGGDGTLNETVTGLIRAGADTPIGYIPSGSTNDFAASMGLSGNILQATQDIIEGSPVAYDIGSFNSRYFSYVASFGAFTRSSYATPQTIKNALGHLAYVLGGIQELSQIRKEHVRFETDREIIEDDFLFGAICNATSIGGILTLDPSQVDMSDGLMELLLVRAPRNLGEIAECITTFQSGSFHSCGMVTFTSAHSMTVYADPQMPWTLDGEREDGHDLIRVENLHRAIRLVHRSGSHD